MSDTVSQLLMLQDKIVQNQLDTRKIQEDQQKILTNFNLTDIESGLVNIVEV